MTVTNDQTMVGTDKHFSRLCAWLAGLWNVNSTVCSSRLLVWHKNACARALSVASWWWSRPASNCPSSERTHLALQRRGATCGLVVLSQMKTHSRPTIDKQLLFARITFACSCWIWKWSSTAVMATAKIVNKNYSIKCQPNTVQSNITGDCISRHNYTSLFFNLSIQSPDSMLHLA